MVWLALITLTDGRRAGFWAVLGVTVGLALVGAAVAFGLGTVVAQSPAAYQILRVAGSAYLLWLAWEAWQSQAQTHTALGQDAGSALKYFRRGLITNVLNPKAFLFYVAVLPAFLPPLPAPRDTAALCVVYVAVASGVHAAIVAGASRARTALGRQDYMQTIGRSAAMVLVLLAVWLWFKT